MKCRLIPALALPFLLTACGGGDSAIDGAREIPNRFGNTVNALDDFNPGSTGDSGNTAGLKANEVRITMEVPAFYAPDAEQTRRNLRIVTPDQVQVYRSNQGGQNLGTVPYSTSTGEDGHVIVSFPDGQPIGPDVVIEARYSGGGQTIAMKALAADSDRDVKVNPFSHYLVQNGLGGYSSTEFQAVMDCVNDRGGALCLNKYVWSSLADQVHDFEIDIAGNLKLDAAIGMLASRADFAGYIDQMADYALLGPNASGTIRASSADYNSVFLGLELGPTFRDARFPGAGQWGARTAQEEDLGGAFLYPALTLTSFEAFNINVTSLATDIPYDRSTLVHGFTNPDGHQFSRETGWTRNSHSSSPGAATLTPPSEDGSDPARLLAGRALYQSITDEPGSANNGWTRNPYFMDAFTSAPGTENQSPDRVLGSYFTAGKAIALADADGKLKRQQTLEEHYLSVLELHLLRSEDFNMAGITGSDYNLVYLTAQFGGSNPITFEIGYGELDGSDGALTTNNATIYRDNTGAAGAGASSAVTDTWNIANRPAQLSSGIKNIGRLALCRSCTESEPPLGLGAATPDGSLLAFNLDDTGLGDGLVIAGKTTTLAAPIAGDYRVQGTIIAMDADQNRLYQVAEGTLTLTDTGADLKATSYRVSHTITENTVGTAEEDVFNLGFTVTPGGNGSIQLAGGELVLNGFYTESGDQIFLVVQDNTGPELRTGLLIATLIPESTAAQ
ncbi:hypothetical protein Q666_14310 [Marinobacter sp. ES-1]|uniref:hypothetical protein n=1 Tax=Marinobacter sp. ES-1 TaxID=1396858 RepID=UPI0003B924FE|nr:hypothetical protein [Marinobacter sp. ES-1]ERP89806.1 hypothetical protein Q666_14310 [Marinobacter sp. ES-1]